MKLALALVLLALPLPLMAQAPVAADTPGKTAAGVSYTQPKDWSVMVKGPATIFTAPESDLDIAVVQVGEASDGPAAVAKAWTLYRPEAARTPRMTVPGTAGDGWDERVSVAYEVSPNEKKIVSAGAMRVGKAWTVVITNGGEATANKRSSATGLIQGSLLPAGYTPETFAGRKAHRLTPERIQALRDFVAQSAQALGVPGVGMALIDQNKVVWQGGVGVRELGGTEKVDEHTKFMIASNTKGMATLLLSVLADEGKLRWDQKVTELYPSFRLGNGDATGMTEVRHLVCACTGLPRKDYAFILDSEGVPATDTFRQLSLTTPTSKFGELFQYSNLMASAAGYVGGHLAYPDMEIGAAFDKAMQTRIFGPLGMKDTGFDNAAAETGNWARPHGFDVNGKLVEIPNYFNHLIVPHRPAGGAWSTAADMALYAQLELTKGIAPSGKRIVSEANILKRREHNVPLGENGWYGMGLMDRVDTGVHIVTHGGTLQGYHSSFWVLPEEGIGAVILTNSDPGASMLGPFLRRLLEVVYDGKPEAAQSVAAAAARLKAGAEARRARLTVPGDPAIFAGLASQYRDADGRVITISDKDGGKWMKAGFIEGPLATRKNPDGSISIVSIGGGNIGVDAVVGTSNAGRTLTIRDSQHEYAYTEVK